MALASASASLSPSDVAVEVFWDTKTCPIPQHLMNDNVLVKIREAIAKLSEAAKVSYAMGRVRFYGSESDLPNIDKRVYVSLIPEPERYCICGGCLKLIKEGAYVRNIDLKMWRAKEETCANTITRHLYGMARAAMLHQKRAVFLVVSSDCEFLSVLKDLQLRKVEVMIAKKREAEGFVSSGFDAYWYLDVFEQG